MGYGCVTQFKPVKMKSTQYNNYRLKWKCCSWKLNASWRTANVVLSLWQVADLPNRKCSSSLWNFFRTTASRGRANSQWDRSTKCSSGLTYQHSFDSNRETERTKKTSGLSKRFEMSVFVTELPETRLACYASPSMCRVSILQITSNMTLRKENIQWE